MDISELAEGDIVVLRWTTGVVDVATYLGEACAGDEGPIPVEDAYISVSFADEEGDAEVPVRQIVGYGPGVE